MIKNFNSYRTETLWQVNHTEEEPYIYDFIIVSLIEKKWFARLTPCQTYWLKLIILFTENSWTQSYG